LAVVFVFFSCKPNDSLGISIQPAQDKIGVAVDTFYLQTTDSLASAISAQCADSMSMLLGEYYSEKYGAVKADLIVQVAPPLGYEFPDAKYNPQPDSVILYMFYRSYFGSKTEPFEISIYKLNKKTPEYSVQYLTNLDVSEFLDINNNNLLGKKITTSINQSLKDSVLNSTSYTPTIKYFFSPQQMKDFFDEAKGNVYSKTEDFLNAFKGLYITTTYGKSTMLYLFEIDLKLYYHYTYTTKTNSGLDTVITVNTYITYPANKEVRQLNVITHDKISEKINLRDSVNYITATAGIYPRITLPVAKISQKMKSHFPNKDIFINSAIVSIEATEIDSSKTAMPIPGSLLVLPVKEFDNLIKTNSIKIVNNDSATIATYNSSKKEYTVNMAYLLNKAKNDSITNADYLLIPIDVFSSSSGLSEIRPAKRIGAVTVRSGKNAYSPMRLELVYSGF